MSKIAIFTVFRGLYNYGQILQAYALTEYLNKNGHDAFLVEYKHDVDATRVRYEQYESFGYWLPVYLLGSFIGYNNTKINHPQHSLFYIFLFIAITITSYYTIIPLFFYRLLSPIILWFLADLYIKNYLLIRFKEKQWMHYTFFIYCTHFFILNILQKLIFIYIPISSVFITSPIITIYLLIQIAKWLSNYSLYKYFTGGR